MSQRALKKKELSLQKQEKESHQIYRKQSQPHKSKYTQRNSTNVLSKQTVSRVNQIDSESISESKHKFRSTPNLVSLTDSTNQLVRCHSESDLSCVAANNPLVNAKSEFHLKSIASTQVPDQNRLANNSNNLLLNSVKKSAAQLSAENEQNMSKRLSIHSGISFQTGSSMTTSSTSESSQPPTVGFVDTENIRIPIVGYEVMEERARFTVYKLRIENPFTNDCWLVLRRYTDFQRLNNKIKSTFPHLPPLTLPRKKLFGDNFSSLFLSNRVFHFNCSTKFDELMKCQTTASKK